MTSMAGNVVDLSGEHVGDDTGESRTTADALREIADDMDAGKLSDASGFILVAGTDDGLMLMDGLGSTAMESIGVLETAKAMLMAGDDA
jgi:hypothetical protein